METDIQNDKIHNNSRYSSFNIKIINILLLVVLVAAIPLTVFLAQRQQEIRQRAQVAPQNLRVFVTSTTYNGNLGGTAGADAKCVERAQAARLPGTWKAWVSALGENAKDRIDDGKYILTTGAVVANSKAGLLLSGTNANQNILLNKINITEGQTEIGSGVLKAWTGTDINGNAISNCSGWTKQDNGTRGVRGKINATNGHWTKDGEDGCRTLLRLYCFEQAAAPTPTPTPTGVPPTPTPPGPTATPTPTGAPPTPTLTVTPSPTITQTPTLTPTPTPTGVPPTPTPTSGPLSADIDRNGCIDIRDFNEWVYTMQHNGTPRQTTYRPDVNGDTQVNILDFNGWFNAMRSGQNLCTNQ